MDTFKIGDNIKVVSGKYSGRTGTIMSTPQTDITLGDYIVNLDKIPNELGDRIANFTDDELELAVGC